MAGENVVEIRVTAANLTQAGFDEAKAGADDTAVAFQEYADAALRAEEATAALGDAQGKLAQLQAEETASADEVAAASDAVAAAQDRMTRATLASLDAQIKLTEAELRTGTAAKAEGDEMLVAGGKADEAGAEAAGASGKFALGRTAMLGLAGGLAAIGYESIKMAIGFQRSMTLLVTQAGVSEKQMGSLKSGVLALAGQVGFSPDSLAESLYHVASNMASLGATAPRMLDVVRIAAEGAKVGNANLVDVTNALTAAISSGIPGVKNYAQAMGMLNSIVGSGDMTMQNLAEAFGSGMVAVVKGYGLSLKDVGAALAVFGDNNIRGAHAGTQLRMSVQALAAPAAAGIPVLKQLGMGANQLALDMQHGGLLQALQDLTAHFHKAGITAKTEGGYITDIFGKKAGAGIAVLLEQMGRLESKYPKLEEGSRGFGKAWQDTKQTVGVELDRLRGTMDALGVTIGQKVLPVAQAFLGFLANHSGAVLAIASALGILVGVLGLYKAAVMAAEVVTGLFDAVLDANPITIIVVAIVGLVAAFIYLWNHVKAFRDFFKDAWRDIQNWAMDAWHAIDHVFHAIGHAVADAVDFIKSHWQLILGILTGPIGLAVYFIRSHWDQIVSGAAHMISAVVGFFERLPGDILRALGDFGHLLWNAGVHVIEGLIGGIKSAVGAVWSTIKSIGSGISHAFGDVLHIFSPSRVFAEHGRNIVRGLVAGIEAERGTALAAARRLALDVGRVAGGRYALPGLAAAGPAGGGVLRLELDLRAQSGDGPLMTALLRALRAEIRQVGGGGPNSVQIALGRTH